MGAPARGQAAGVTHDGHTLDTLAHALRGMPRDAPILVELPDGRLVPVRLVRIIAVGPGATQQTTAGTGRTGIVLQLNPPA